ncbi:hypothetical protein [Halococcus thailandensis]|uniref:Uncharacterized protein n=1 Tax=Halococcus thailandensis JCM 13552 TaxID=1227457 RepID=M0N4R7_9EURY|nr:hypothetical protein [Halococcus thailandensis]EMA52881.1 hypothetical protein C451_10690 [Halococcus thailandensis JCM 13552]
MDVRLDRESFDDTRRAEVGAVAGATGTVVAVGAGASGPIEIALVTGLVALVIGYGIMLTAMIERR